MIFRITVHDNDFTDILERFANNLFDRIYWLKDKSNEMDLTEWYEKIYKPKQKVQKVMNSNITSSLTDEEKGVLCAAVFLEQCDYVDSLPKRGDTKEYLKKYFEVSVGFDFTDQWENGEVVYYFTANQKWISQ